MADSARRLALPADLFLPALLGAIATLGFAPWHLYPATLVALFGLLALWRGAGIGRGAVRGFVFGCAFFGCGVHWVYSGLHGYGGLDAPLAGLATGGLILYCAGYGALTGAFAAATRRIAPSVWALLLVPAAWGLGELLRGWIGGGFPWLSLGYITVAAPLNGLAPLVGVYGLSIATVAAAGTLWLLYTAGLAARLLALLIIAALPCMIWWLPAPAHWTQRAGPALGLAVVQANGGHVNPWLPAPVSSLANYRDITSHSDADLVIWPALAVAAPAGELRAYLAPLQKKADESGQTLLAGILSPNAQGRGLQSRLLALVPEYGQAGADKKRISHIVLAAAAPGLLARWLGLSVPLAPAGARTTRSPAAATRGVTLAAALGFQDLSTRAIQTTLPKAGIVVSITHDAWLAGTMETAQHLEVARMRALEAGRPVVRSVDTGTSAVIDYDGRLYASLAPHKDARLTARVISRRGLTPFMLYGDAPLWWATIAIVLIGLFGAAGLAWQRRRLRRPAERRRALRERV